MLLLQVARAAGPDEVTGAVLAEGGGLQVGDLIAPVDVVLEHVRGAHGFGVHRPQAVARGDQVVDRDPWGQRAAGQAGVFEHRAALQQPMFGGPPFELAEQAPRGVVQGAVEVGFRVGPVIAIVGAGDQSQAVGQAQGVLDLQVVARFPGALVDVAAQGLRGAVAPLVTST